MDMTDYEWLTKMGLCHKCRREKSVHNKKYCFSCLDKIREYNAKHYDSEKAKSYQVRRREIYREKKENGICVRCTKKATHGLYCYEHSIYAKRRSREIAESRKRERHKRGLIQEIRLENGLCYICGEPTTLFREKAYICDKCYEKMCESAKNSEGYKKIKKKEAKIIYAKGCKRL